FWRDVWERGSDHWLLQAGQYTVTPDHRPLIGETAVPGLFVNTGYSGHGIMLGPAAGRICIDALTGAAGASANPFRPDRVLATRPAAFQVAVHAGAQTTADTVALAAHALEAGADAVAVIAPPYFPLDDEELFRHLRAASGACDPVPFYVYAFAGRSGYPVPVP